MTNAVRAYDDGDFRIYNGEALEVLAELPDASVDVCVTDPPYGINLDYGTVADNWRPTRELWAQVHRVLRPGGSLHMTVSNRHLPFWLDEPKAAGFHYLHCSVYWNRQRAGGNANGQFAYAWEPILHFGRDGTIKLANRMLSDVIPHTGRKTTDHSAERDIEAWHKLLYVLPGDVVLDPFVGSGTTLRAAKDLGRRGIGIERNPSFWRMAVERMGQEVLFGKAASAA